LLGAIHMLRKIASGQTQRYSLLAIFWFIAIVLGALQAWTNLYSLSSDDIISYLDIGDAYLRGEWNVAINGYWSPLYSWLLGLTMLVLKPSPYWEFPVVKLVNFLIYLFALVCFEFFLHQLVFYYREQISQAPSTSFKIPKWAWIVSGYTLFIWSSLQWIGIYCDTPDMCVAAFVYLAAGLVLRIHKRSENWFNFIMLGAVLGFSYLSKAAMFPIAFVFLAVSIFSVGFSISSLRRALPQILASILIFTLISTPFIVALSTAKGRLTFGDTGKLNYSWIVASEVKPYRFWQGNESGSGTPKHPPRKIFDNPEVFEFGTPVGGTYPPWYDPSYWYEGLKIKFNFTRQIAILVENAIYYYYLLGSLIFGYLILVFLSGKFWLSVKNLTESWRLLIPAVAGNGIYMLAQNMPEQIIDRQPSTRYIAAFIVLLFAGVFSSVRLNDSQETKRVITGMTIAALVTIGGQLFYQNSQYLLLLRHPEQHIQWQVADSLKQLGFQAGEKIAIIGKYTFPSYHWARLARAKIVAEIPDETSFWDKDAAVRSEVIKTIQRTGATVIVQKPGLQIPPDCISAIGWQEIGNTGYYVDFLRK
jgi:hypothetical protein